MSMTTTPSSSFSLETSSIAPSTIGSHFSIDLRMDTATIFLQIGILYQHRGSYEDAVESLEQALLIRKELYEKEDCHEVMEACQALALAYEQCGEVDLAVKSYFAVSQMTASLNNDKGSGIRNDSMNQSPQKSKKNENYDDCGGHCEEELPVGDGGHFVEIAQMCNDKCCALIEVNDKSNNDLNQALLWNEQAVLCCKEGMEYSSSIFENNDTHSDTGSSRLSTLDNNHGDDSTIQNSNGDNSRLGSILQHQLLEAMELRCQIFLLSESDEQEEVVISHYREIIELQEHIYGPYHPIISQTLLSMGDLYLSRKVFDSAKELYIKAYSIYHDFGIGPSDPGCLVARSKIEEVEKQLLGMVKAGHQKEEQVVKTPSTMYSAGNRKETSCEKYNQNMQNDIWDDLDSDDDSSVMVETREQSERMRDNNNTGPWNGQPCDPNSVARQFQIKQSGKEDSNHEHKHAVLHQDKSSKGQNNDQDPKTEEDKKAPCWNVMACDNDDVSAITQDCYTLSGANADCFTFSSMKERVDVQKTQQHKIRAGGKKEWNIGILVSKAVGTIQEATELFLDNHKRRNSYVSEEGSDVTEAMEAIMEMDTHPRVRSIGSDRYTTGRSAEISKYPPRHDVHHKGTVDKNFEDSSSVAGSALLGLDIISVDKTVESSTLNGLDVESMHKDVRSKSPAFSVNSQDISIVESTLLGLDLVSKAEESQINTDESDGNDYESTDHSALLGQENNSTPKPPLIEMVKNWPVSNDITSNGMDNLLAKMNVVSCEMAESDAKPFEEVVNVNEVPQEEPKTPSKNEMRKKESTRGKIRVHRELLMDQKLKLGTTHEKVLKTMFSLAKLYHLDGDFAKAISIYNDVYHIQLERYGGSSNEVAITCTKLGDLYRIQGEFEKAMKRYIDSRDIQLFLYGESDHRIALILNRMGLVELERCDFDVAMDYLMEALKIQQQHLAPNEHNPDVSQTLVNIGAVYYKERNSFKTIRSKKNAYKQFIESGMLGRIAFAHAERGEYIMAMHFYQEVLHLLCNRGEERSSAGIVMTLNLLGSLNMKSGRYVVAMDFHERALRALQKNCDHSDVDLADTKTSIGIVEYHCGNFQKALSLFEEVIPVQKKLLGVSHPRVARTIYHLGVVHSILCNYDEARSYLNTALSTQYTILEKDHPDTLNTLSSIGRLNLELDDVDRALQQFEAVLSGQRRIFGNCHPDIVETLNRLGLVHENLGNRSEAMKCFEKSFNLGKKLLGLEHPMIATTLSGISRNREQDKKYTKAMLIYQDCLRIRKECLGENHYEIAVTLSSIGSLNGTLRKYGDAMSNFQEAKNIALESFDSNHPFHGDIIVAESAVQMQRCHFDEARQLLTFALEKYRHSNLPENHSKIQKALKEIARVDHEEQLCV